METLQEKHGAKILVVDDEMFFRSLLRDILTQNGWSDVIEAADGDEAVLMYREHAPSLVLMDIYMPDKSGIDSTREIISINPAAKILICSGVGYDQDLQAALQAGAKDVIYKPFYETEVVESVKKTLAG